MTITVPIRMAVTVSIRMNTIAIHSCAINLGLRIRRGDAFAPRLGERNNQEGSLRKEQNQRQNGRRGVDVELRPPCARERDGAGRKVRANGGPDAEADRKRDADMCKRL